MASKTFDIGDAEIAWCPGCGNFGILDILKEALMDLKINPNNLVIVSGIGQAAKTPHYLKCNFFNGLHGRALSPATGIKMSNPNLTVIAESGDGDMYGEGGNHFLHTIRRNPDITNIVHNNMVYGLTKGQASPTSRLGFRTPIQVDGVSAEPFNPLSVAIALNASFVARAYCGDKDNTKEIIKTAISHRGYSLVDLFQPCVTFNKENTYQWFKENTYYLEKDYDPTNRLEAFKRSIEVEKLPLGIFYVNKSRIPFETGLEVYKKWNVPLYERDTDINALRLLINSLRP
jgi:2-oxoglutarate/2-oxoacid ferredoxin oxidoreductase subunit beta